MSTFQQFYDTQLTAEIKKYTLDLTAFVPSGGSVSSATATYAQTYGGSVSGSCATSVSASGVTFTAPALSAAGLYTYTVAATMTDSQIRKAVYIVRVDA